MSGGIFLRSRVWYSLTRSLTVSSHPLYQHFSRHHNTAKVKYLSARNKLIITLKGSHMSEVSISLAENSYEDVISAFNDFFDQWDLSSIILMEEMRGPQRRTMLKNKSYLVSFNNSILVSPWTFQLTFVRTLFSYLRSEYLGEPMNFSSDSCSNLIWSHFLRVSWWAYELFSRPLFEPYLVTFLESILVSLWTFQPTLVRTLFGHISWEYLGEPMNFSADPCSNLIWSHFLRVSWWAYELFSRPLFEPYLVTFLESILVSLGTFQSTLQFGKITYLY